ncbi:hypothetical protein ILYODFUR_013223 [Ilyodon furcidens]|uniref:Uncharacterized protein n=1 Tax=Ilyodon furcidens TaxID=33524 RepID=A0ABV0SKV7_9TELE
MIHIYTSACGTPSLYLKPEAALGGKWIVITNKEAYWELIPEQISVLSLCFHAPTCDVSSSGTCCNQKLER